MVEAGGVPGFDNGFVVRHNELHVALAQDNCHTIVLHDGVAIAQPALRPVLLGQVRPPDNPARCGPLNDRQQRRTVGFR